MTLENKYIIHKEDFIKATEGIYRTFDWRNDIPNLVWEFELEKKLSPEDKQILRTAHEETVSGLIGGENVIYSSGLKLDEILTVKFSSDQNPTEHLRNKDLLSTIAYFPLQNSEKAKQKPHILSIKFHARDTNEPSVKVDVFGYKNWAGKDKYDELKAINLWTNAFNLLYGSLPRWTGLIPKNMK